MIRNREIEGYIELGQRNKEVVRLVSNFCAHAKVIVEGGIGELEIQTGLPIGMRRVGCPHERARGMASMHMEQNALDFYDRNCFDCPLRQPVTLPNLLSEVVTRREQAVAEAQKVRDQELAREESALARRADARHARQTSSSPEARGVLELLDAFDRKPSTDSAAALIEALRAAPTGFTPTVWDLILAVVDAGGLKRSEGALELFPPAERLDGDIRQKAVLAALRAIVRGEASDVAIDIVARWLEPLHATSSEVTELLAEAAPQFVYLAAPIEERFFHSARAAKPAPLVAAWKAAPSKVEAVLRRILRTGAKNLRRAGALAIEALAAVEPSVYKSFVDDLIASFSGDDDGYNEGEASQTTALILAKALEVETDLVDQALAVSVAQGTTAEKIGAMRAYAALLPRRREVVPTVSHTPIQERAVQRLLGVGSNLAAPDELIEEVCSLFDRYTLPLSLQRLAIPAFLGVAALAIGQASVKQSNLVTNMVDDLQPPMLRQLDAENRRALLRSWADRALGIVFKVATSHPESLVREEAIAALLDMLQNLPEEEDMLRSKLIERLGKLTVRADNVTRILPILYRAFMGRSVRVRGAAATAYEDLCKNLGAENVPPLVHQAFLVVLSDDYVLVHSEALYALGHIDIPDEYCARAAAIVTGIVRAYQSGKESDILSRALSVWLRLLDRLKVLTPERKAEAIRLIRRLPAYLADDFIGRWGYLTDGSGYSELILWLLTDRQTLDGAREEALKELEGLGTREIRRLSAQVVDVGKALAQRKPGRARLVLQILSDAELRVEARNLAQHLVAVCGTTSEFYARRLRAMVDEAAIFLEESAAQGKGDEVLISVRRIRELQKDIDKDAQENRERRRPLVELREKVLPYLNEYQPRLELLEALCAARLGNGDAAQFEAIATRLTETAAVFGETDPLGSPYNAMAILARSMAHLVRWHKALHTAELDSQRHLVAAKLACRALAMPQAATAQQQTQFQAIAGRLQKVREANVDEVAALALMLMVVPVRIPLLIPERPRDLYPKQSEPVPEQPTVTPIVAFIRFRLNGVDATEPLSVRHDVLHDLDVEVNLSRWPADAKGIELVPLHVELPGTLEVSPFSFKRPATVVHGQAITLSGRGRIIVRAAQDLLARPLSLQFMGSATDAEGEPILRLVVQGQRQLSLHSFDPYLTPQSGYLEIDNALVSIRDQARLAGIDDRQLADFITLLVGVGRVAGQALADGIYPHRLLETPFQSDLRDRLRGMREIGSDLEEHPRAAGGITDLSFRRIRLELKVDDRGVTVDSVVMRYGQQLVQYVAASDRRCGVLAVLDNEAKSVAPGSVRNDIALRTIPPPSGSGTPILIGVVIIRGCLARPSALSH